MSTDNDCTEETATMTDDTFVFLIYRGTDRLSLLTWAEAKRCIARSTAPHLLTVEVAR
jgi:hypothetical protein